MRRLPHNRLVGTLALPTGLNEDEVQVEIDFNRRSEL